MPDTGEPALTAYELALVELLLAHHYTGVKGNSWDEPKGMRESCYCRWEKSYAFHNTTTRRALWPAHVARQIAALPRPAAGLAMVTSMTTLGALPEGVVLRTADGLVRQLNHSQLIGPFLTGFDGRHVVGRSDLGLMLPATILDIPFQDDDETQRPAVGLAVGA